jgi:hypothetical protein
MISKFRVRTFFICFICLIAGLFAALYAQTPSPAPVQVSTLLAGSVAALTGGNSIQDTTLQGTANYTLGSTQDTGPATLQALGHVLSSLTLNLTGGQQGEIQNGAQAAWIGANGQQNLEALQNSLYPAAWFFPALSVGGFAQDSNYSASFVGAEQFNGARVNHLRITWTVPGTGDPGTMALLSQLSTTDLYLNATTQLPTALAFNVYANNDTTITIPVQIQYSNYTATGGLQVPYHIQKFLNGTLMLDLSVTSVVTNSGLSPGNFQIQ